MSLNDYSNLIKLSQMKLPVGTFVHIYHDSFIHTVKNNVLGRYDDHHVGKVVQVDEPCVQVQYGSETNIGTYDIGTLGIVTVGLKPTAITKTGSLGDPSQGNSGFIREWSNFGKGDALKIYNPATATETMYPVSDLEFRIGESVLGGLLSRRGGRRVTLRQKKRSSLLTRFLKRV